MNFPGDCQLTLSAEAISRAIEDALNGTRLAGEDRIRVTDVARDYSYGPWRVSITTDTPAAPEVTALKVAA